MPTRIKLLCSVMLVGALLAVWVPLLHAGGTNTSSTPLKMELYSQVVDEQDTTAFYNNGGVFCAGSTLPIQNTALTGDSKVAGPTTAYDSGAPWTTASALSSTSYVNGTSCGANCLSVQFRSNNKIFSLDTRGTSGPRALSVSFNQACGLPECPGPAGDPTVFGGSVTTAGLLQVFLDFSYPGMQVCSSTTCPEAQPAFAKFWFTDPNDSSVTWRIDWHFLRVLRISTNTWYFIGDECDGSQIAGLSKLTGKRTNPTTVFNGYYKIPFFFSAAL